MKQAFVVYSVILVSLFQCSLAQTFKPFPDTGQTKCYNDTHEIPCPSSGQPFYGQDAQHPRVPRSYTKLGHGGTVLPDNAIHVDDGGKWIMTRDNVTGLIWEVKTSANSWDEYTWSGAQDQFIPGLNNATFGGFSDWRLPDVKELSSLLYLTNDNLIDLTWFPNNEPHPPYWSSTPDVSTTYAAWWVDFKHGCVDKTNKSNWYSVRAVRS